MTENSSDTPKYLVLPCTGVEKLTGQLTSLVAVNLIQKDPEINILLTPSLPQIAAQLPKEIDNLQKTSIIVLNGCGSQCVTKILTNLNLKAEKTYLITQFLKGKAYHPQSSVQLSPKEVDLVPQIAEELYSDIKNNIFSKKSVSNGILLEFNPEYTDWKEFVYSKFIFKMPVRNRDFYFNGNDVWAYIMGNHVFVGITDYMQKQLSDIITVEFPKIGQQIEQFDGVGSLESTKTVNEIICPISGKIIAINQNLTDSPDLINSDPYTKGWIYVIEPSNLADEIENLMKPEEYFKEMIEKIQQSSH